jgi:hypothetical protein
MTSQEMIKDSVAQSIRQKFYQCLFVGSCAKNHNLNVSGC